MRRAGPAVFAMAVSALLSACAAPPTTEMDRAQGAIDAARAAGAEQYAPTEYSAASAALKSANDAVAARDFRLALNYALQSHEYAQNAARVGADTKARVRAEVERAVTDLTALVAAAEARKAAPDAVAVARASLQEAGTAVAAGDYLAANDALDGAKQALEQALADADAAQRSQSLRRRR